MTALTVGASFMDSSTTPRAIYSRAAPVVHVITDAGPHPYFRTLAESPGFDRSSVIVGCVGPAGALQADMHTIGVTSFALGAEGRTEYPRATAKLAHWLRRVGAPVLQSHLVDGSLVGLTAARLARTPLAVFTAHHSHELPFHGRKLIWADRLCAGPLSDRVIAPSQQVRETLIEFTHIQPDKVAVIHHGFDLTALDPTRLSGAAIRSELSLEDKLVIGAVGRVYEIKNYAALLSAFAEVLGDVREAHLVIVGPGDTGPLIELAGRLGIAGRVTLTGPRVDVPQLLAAFDVFVHPALAESFGMVIVEAMALAKPVVSTPVGIAPEVITDGETGVLCLGEDASALAGGLRRMLELRQRWTELGGAARRRVSGFSAEAMSAAYNDLYTAELRARRVPMRRKAGANGSAEPADS